MSRQVVLGFCQYKKKDSIHTTWQYKVAFKEVPRDFQSPYLLSLTENARFKLYGG